METLFSKPYSVFTQTSYRQNPLKQAGTENILFTVLAEYQQGKKRMHETYGLRCFLVNNNA